MGSVDPTNWRFDDKHGKNIELSNKGQTAEKLGDLWDGRGIVVGCLPMQVNTLYEVRLDKRDTDVQDAWSMYTGVTDAAADTLTLPSSCWGFTWKAAIVIRSACVMVRGEEVKTLVGKNLKNLPVNSRVGVLVDDKCDLHLYIDGQDQGVAAPNAPDPCYPFFELRRRYKQITALPAAVIKDSPSLSPSPLPSSSSTSQSSSSPPLPPPSSLLAV